MSNSQRIKVLAVGAHSDGAENSTKPSSSALDRLKLRANTMIVYFSDNGGPPTNGAWNLPLAGSKFTLWEGGIRVPFILSRPNDPHAGKTWTQPTSALDVYPTILDAVGIQIPEDLDGQVIGKDESQANRNLYWNLYGTYALRSGNWKLLNNATFKDRKPTSGVVYRPQYAKGIRLFNLKDDPGESKDLSQSHPEVKQRLQKLYAEWSKTTVGTIGKVKK